MRAPGLGRVLYWAITAFAIVVTVYMEIVLGSDALEKREWSTIGIVVVLGFLIWSIGLAFRVLLGSD
jgi:hypothetical protein